MAGHYLKEWREHRGLTQEQASEASGVSQSVLTRLESNKREYKERHLEALAKAYRCTTAELLGTDPTASSGEVISMMDRMLKIPPHKREQALRILDTFTEDKEEG